MFCFPNTGHAFILENCLFQILIDLRAFLRIIYEKTKGKVSLDLYWENKTFTLNRSISLAAVLKIIPNDQTSQYRDENLAVTVSLFCCLCWKKILRLSVWLGNCPNSYGCIERFHMTPRRPYWCSKTMKRQPC